MWKYLEEFNPAVADVGRITDIAAFVEEVDSKKITELQVRELMQAYYPGV